MAAVSHGSRQPRPGCTPGLMYLAASSSSLVGCSTCAFSPNVAQPRRNTGRGFGKTLEVSGVAASRYVLIRAHLSAQPLVLWKEACSANEEKKSTSPARAGSVVRLSRCSARNASSRGSSMIKSSPRVGGAPLFCSHGSSSFSRVRWKEGAKRSSS